jgi:PPOX class probable F420-dependent enzyme
LPFRPPFQVAVAEKKIRAGVDDLFAGQALAHLATITASGRPLVSPVWIDRDGEMILVNSAAHRVKNRNMAVGAQVALAIADPANPYRYVSVQGVMVERRQEGAHAKLDRLSQRYLGKPYPWAPAW